MPLDKPLAYVVSATHMILPQRTSLKVEQTNGLIQVYFRVDSIGKNGSVWIDTIPPEWPYDLGSTDNYRMYANEPLALFTANGPSVYYIFNRRAQAIYSMLLVYGQGATGI